MDNNYIDEMVRDSIGEYEMAFDPADWDAMEEHLEKDTRVRRKLYATKAIEACLMLVTVWTIMQFVEIDNSSTYQPTLIERQETTPPSVEDEQIAPLQNDKQEQDRSLEKTTFPQNEFNPFLRNVPIANNTSSEFETIEAKKRITKTASFNKNNKSKIIDFKKNVNETNAKAIPIASLDTRMLNVNNNIYMPLMETAVTGEQKSQKMKAGKFRIGGFVAGDMVKINTPDNYLVSKKAHLFNASGGVMIDRKLKEKLKIETGAIFAYRKHSERSFSAATYDPSYLAMENGTINTASIEIPVNLLYEICNNDKNVFYALGGVSNHFALTVKKQIEDYNQLNGNATSSGNQGVFLDGSSNEREGLLASKEVPNNHFASVNIGAGYERKLNKRISLFAQATFKKGFGKLGAHDDDITTVSLSAGVKSIL